MRCNYCMEQMENGSHVCPHCGKSVNASPAYLNALPMGTLLYRRFRVGAPLGKGGFGITYIGYDNYLNQKVAIKEYFPESVCCRAQGSREVSWTEESQHAFGCDSIVQEAQKMATVDRLPAAVRVWDVFFENRTAYIVMDYVEGVTLKAKVEKEGNFSPEKCLKLLDPVLDTLSRMHSVGMIHRDISPDNIMVEPNGNARLLDLGAAKNLKQESSCLSQMMAKNGFSPPEQYSENGKIGTWTDVYAITATIYYVLLKRVPSAALDRCIGNKRLSIPQDSRIPAMLVTVLEQGMCLDAEHRIQSIEQLKQQLHDAVDIKEKEEASGSFLQKLHGLFRKKKQTENRENTPNLKEYTRKRPSGMLPSPETVRVDDPQAEPMYQVDDIAGYSHAGAKEGLPCKAWLMQESTGKRLELYRCLTILGREGNGKDPAKADCLIEDSTRRISRCQAAILYDGNHFFVQDISGKNHFVLNDTPILFEHITGKEHSFRCAYRLYEDDVLRIAGQEFRFHACGRIQHAYD